MIIRSFHNAMKLLGGIPTVSGARGRPLVL